MKRSDNGRETGRHRCLIVDGYNFLPQWLGIPLPKMIDLEGARLNLAGRLMEYSSITGEDVLLVFDAHQTLQRPREESLRGSVSVIYTDRGETADERIERLVRELSGVYRYITVVTSDALEQQITFGGGALRISAREFSARLGHVMDKISANAKESGSSAKVGLADKLSKSVAEKLEALRRGEN
ncbi:MAG: NYN domain-containing protein [Alicyclobacillaceae bacterium]|nr:NYN domain-containing protein [Alicyclobacillaceae bacterium]